MSWFCFSSGVHVQLLLGIGCWADLVELQHHRSILSATKLALPQPRHILSLSGGTHEDSLFILSHPLRVSGSTPVPHRGSERRAGAHLPLGPSVSVLVLNPGGVWPGEDGGRVHLRLAAAWAAHVWDTPYPRTSPERGCTTLLRGDQAAFEQGAALHGQG